MGLWNDLHRLDQILTEQGFEFEDGHQLTLCVNTLSFQKLCDQLALYRKVPAVACRIRSVDTSSILVNMPGEWVFRIIPASALKG